MLVKCQQLTNFAKKDDRKTHISLLLNDAGDTICNELLYELANE